MVQQLRSFCIILALALCAPSSNAAAQRLPGVVRGDTLIRMTSGEHGLEIAYLVTPSEVVAVRLGGNTIRTVLAPHEAAVIRAQWKSLKTGEPLDTALLTDILRNAMQKARVAPPTFRLTRTLKNGMRLDFHGDTIRFVPGPSQPGETRLFTINASGAFLINKGTKQPIPEQLAGLLAFLRSTELDSLELEARLAELLRDR